MAQQSHPLSPGAREPGSSNFETDKNDKFAKNRCARSTSDRAQFLTANLRTPVLLIATVGGPRASGLLSVVNRLCRIGLASPVGTAARPRGFPEQRSPERWRARPPKPQRRRTQSAPRPSAVPKRHGVGRVARRARPGMAWRRATLRTSTPPYPKGGA